jgi:hypothetical protein
MVTDAELRLEIDELCRQHGVEPPVRKKVAVGQPRVVVAEGEIVRDADVTVSAADVNAREGKARMVEVRRPRPRQEYVTINMQAYAEQRAEREAARRRNRQLDPVGLGLYGRDDEE